jgi:hypothetical protein
LTEAPGQRVVEAHLEADVLAQRRAEFLRDALGGGRGGDTARLGVADQALLAAAQFQADLRQLGGLAGTGFAGDDDDLVVLQRLGDFVAAAGDRQVFGVGDRRQRIAECALGLARGQFFRRQAWPAFTRGGCASEPPSPSGRAARADALPLRTGARAALARLPGEVRAVPRLGRGPRACAARLRRAGARPGWRTLRGAAQGALAPALAALGCGERDGALRAPGCFAAFWLVTLF